jgi:hypothetical protein
MRDARRRSSHHTHKLRPVNLPNETREYAENGAATTASTTESDIVGETGSVSRVGNKRSLDERTIPLMSLSAAMNSSDTSLCRSLECSWKVSSMTSSTSKSETRPLGSSETCNHYFYDDGSTWPFWKRQGHDLHGLQITRLQSLEMATEATTHFFRPQMRHHHRERFLNRLGRGPPNLPEACWACCGAFYR